MAFVSNYHIPSNSILLDAMRAQGGNGSTYRSSNNISSKQIKVTFDRKYVLNMNDK